MKPIVRLATAAALLCVTSSCTSLERAEAQRDIGVTGVQPRTDPETRAAAEREVVRRQQAVRDASELLEEGKRLQAEGDQKGAIQAFQKSVNSIPN